MARSLIQQGRGKLQKAGDAYTDPATVRTEPPPPSPRPAIEGASDKDSISASKNDSGNAGDKESGEDVVIAIDRASKKVDNEASTKQVTARAEPPANRPARRRGRPRGPRRVALTVRVLEDIDARLTTAVETSGLGPQEIIDQALAAWLDRHERRLKG